MLTFAGPVFIEMLGRLGGMNPLQQNAEADPNWMLDIIIFEDNCDTKTNTILHTKPEHQIFNVETAIRFQASHDKRRFVKQYKAPFIKSRGIYTRMVEISNRAY